MSEVSPKIISVDLAKAFPNLEDQDCIFSLVEYLDQEGLTLLHEMLRTKLVLTVIGHDRRNPDVKSLLTRIGKQWQVLERTIKRIKGSDTNEVNGMKTLALAKLETAVNAVKPIE